MPDSAEIHVVDDDRQMREMLTLALSSAGYTVAGYASAEDFLDAYDDAGESARCLVLDVCMPGMNGTQLQTHLHEVGALIPVIVITGKPEVSTAIAAMHGGAFDFLEKPFSGRVLIERVQYALAGNATQRQDRRRKAALLERLSGLTKREREVFDLLVQAHSIKQIATLLDVGVQTVSKHRARVLRKLGAKNEVELAQIASFLGLFGR